MRLFSQKQRTPQELVNQLQIPKQETAQQYPATPHTATTVLRPNKPFGLSQDQIYRLKDSIVCSNENHWNDWQTQLIDGTTDRTKQSQDLICDLFSALDALPQKEVIRLGTSALIRSIESIAKKSLYEFPPMIYSTVLYGIYNQNLCQITEKRNYLQEANIISQLAQALTTQMSDLKISGIVRTAVSVGQETSPPIILGYASRLERQFTTDSAFPVPKKLSLLHIPGGSVPEYKLPLTAASVDDRMEFSCCVHVMVHTHETYTFTHDDGKSESVNLNTPRILTFTANFQPAVLSSDIGAKIQTVVPEFCSAAIEDQIDDLFGHNPAKYKAKYPNGSTLNDDLDIKWQLVDIDFLVARTQGWVEMTEQGDIVVIDRFCYQPPAGWNSAEFTKEDGQAAKRERLLVQHLLKLCSFGGGLGIGFLFVESLLV